LKDFANFVKFLLEINQKRMFENNDD